MAWARFGFAGLGDDLPIDQWIDDQNDYVAQRDSLDAAGREAWDMSTRSGDNLQANRPSDVVALGNAAVGTGDASDGTGSAEINDGTRAPDASGRTDTVLPPTPGQAAPPRYVRAAPGDSISRLLGTSDPDAIAQFQTLNGMDGRSSTIYSGRVYAIPPRNFGEAVRSDTNRKGSSSNASPQPFAVPPSSVSSSVPPATNPSNVLAAAPRNGALRTAARGVEFGLADTAGIVAGALDVGTNVLRTAGLGHRLMNPIDLVNLPSGTSALNQVLSADDAVARYGFDRLAHPSRLVDDVKDVIHRTHFGLDPTLTPPESKTGGSFARYFSAGRNQGRLGANGSLLLLGPTAEAGLSGAVPFEDGVAMFRGMGFDEAQAARLAKPYSGVGHHVAAYQLGLPDWITESPLFRLKPRNTSQGDFYKLHFENDPSFHGTWFGKKIGGSWSGARLGLQKNGLAGRVWDGTPSVLKGAVGTGIAANDAAWNH